MPAAEHSPTKRPSRPHGTGASCTTAMHRPACRCRWVSTFHRRNCSVFKRSRHCSALVSVGHGPILGVRHDNSNSRPGLRKSVHSATRSLHRWKQVIAKAGHQGRWPPQPAGKEGGPHSRPARKVLPRHSPLSSAYRPRRMHRHFPELATKEGGLHSRPARQVAPTAGRQGRCSPGTRLSAPPTGHAGCTDTFRSWPPRQVASTAGRQGTCSPALTSRAPPTGHGGCTDTLRRRRGGLGFRSPWVSVASGTRPSPVTRPATRDPRTTQGTGPALGTRPSRAPARHDPIPGAPSSRAGLDTRPGRSASQPARVSCRSRSRNSSSPSSDSGSASTGSTRPGGSGARRTR